MTSDMDQNLISAEGSVIRKHVYEVSKSLQELQNKVNQLLEDPNERENQELKEKQYLEEIICERDKLRALCNEKDTKLQVTLLEKHNIELELEQERIAFKLRIFEFEKKLAEMETLYKEEQVMRKRYFNVTEGEIQASKEEARKKTGKIEASN